MNKIVTIVGARPQFIKIAPVSKILRTKCQEVLVHTGQHYDYKMAGVFFEELNIPKPDYNLEVGSGTHGLQTGEMLKRIEDVLIKEKPDGVLVYGDTNSTLAAALSASKMHLPIFHVEAGLRSFDKRMPEEINRVLTDHMSSLLFAPTGNAVNNLSNEGITENVHNVGDVMFDAFLNNLQIAEKKYNLRRFGLKEKEYFLATIHRAENTDDNNRLKAIIESLSRLDQLVIFPLHPRTQKRLEEYGLFPLLEESKVIKLIEPVSYLEMIFLEKYSKKIITDSGGVQKEAYFAKVPCYTIRDQTEWTETVAVGWNTLVDLQYQSLDEIINTVGVPNHVEGLYGDGNAAKKIVDIIMKGMQDF
jgi:UDP-GlcNAc3NAcA epimerase